MKLYYGSETDIIRPEYGKGKLTNDYGLGFYLTPSYELAKLWASKSQDGGFLLTFEFDLNNLSILKLDTLNDEDVLKWIAILCKHRFDNRLKEVYKDRIAWLNKKFPINLDGFDVVVGYRADDSYFNYSLNFIRNELSFEVLTKAMRIGKLGVQYVAISKESFNHLHLLKSEKIEHSNAYQNFQKMTLSEFNALKSEDSINNTFIMDLMRKYGD